MILVTRLDGKELVVNADHILTVEATPDTVLLLTSGQKLMVSEPVEEVVDRAAAWHRRVRAGPTLVREGPGHLIPLPRAAGPAHPAPGSADLPAPAAAHAQAPAAAHAQAPTGAGVQAPTGAGMKD